MKNLKKVFRHNTNILSRYIVYERKDLFSIRLSSEITAIVKHQVLFKVLYEES